jgi:hypothetical protein
MKAFKMTVIIALAVSVTACGTVTERGKKNRGLGDASSENIQVDYTTPDIYAFPSGWGNVATKCIGEGQRIYQIEASDGGIGGYFTIVADESCEDPEFDTE